MIWSSSSPSGSPRAGTEAGVAASDWTWDELDGPGMGGSRTQDAADLEARHTQELEHAFRQGRLEGEQSGRQAARQELQSVLGTVRAVLGEIRESRESWEALLGENLVALSTAVARQLLGCELTANPESIRELVNKAAASFPRNEVVKVRMHPSDIACMRDGTDGQASAEEIVGREVRWIPDEEMVPGGYVLEGPKRIVDGRVDEALQRVFWELTDG